MKLSQSVLLVSLVIVSLCIGSVEGTSCASINPFLPILASKGVNLQSQPSKEPSKTNNKCKSEWAPHGTCCDFKSLEEYAKTDGKWVQASLSASDHTFNAIKKAFETIQKTSKKLLQNGLEKNPKLKGFLRLLKTVNSDSALSDWLIKFNKKPAYSLNNFNRCMNTIKETRAGSLCGICSGRSSSFFVGQKGIITSSTCTNILTDCNGLLEFLAQYIQKFRFLLDMISESEFEFIGANGGKFFQNHVSKSIIDSIVSIKSIRFTEVLVRYNSNKNIENTIALCEGFVTLVHQPFSESISTYFDRGNKLLQLFSTELAQLKSKTEKAESWTLVGRSRLLQHDPLGIGMFQPDILVIKTGTSSSSQDTAPDSRFFKKFPIPNMVLF